LWAKVDFNGPIPTHCPELGNCWLWTGMVNEHGYGRIWDESQPNYPFIYVHRLSYILANGPLDEGVDVLHHCDNPPCLRPSHLYAGTQQQNNRDRDARDRVRHGEAHRSAKLTEQEVRAIRKMLAANKEMPAAKKLSLRAIGAVFGVAGATIWEIEHEHIWKRVQ
jgi:hypothetical protein